MCVCVCVCVHASVATNIPIFMRAQGFTLRANLLKDYWIYFDTTSATISQQISQLLN